MKAKTFLLGLTFFAVSMVATFGIGLNHRHHNFKHEEGIKKSAVIEVGAPLTVSERIYMGFI